MLSRLDDLRNLREVLIASIDEAEPDKRAPLANQLRATLVEIDELAGVEPVVGGNVSAIEEARARREARNRSLG